MNRIAILASGSGSNAENIAHHFRGSRNAEVVLFATENPKAFVVERAVRLGIACEVFGMDSFRNGGVSGVLRSYRVDFIVLAGFLKLVPAYLINAFPGRIVNIHPALLPKFGGKGMYGDAVHAAVIAAGERESGITIHHVSSRYDEGSIIFQAKCSVDKNDTPETLAQKVHTLEYAHYPRVIEALLGDG